MLTVSTEKLVEIFRKDIKRIKELEETGELSDDRMCEVAFNNTRLCFSFTKPEMQFCKLFLTTLSLEKEVSMLEKKVASLEKAEKAFVA